MVLLHLALTALNVLMSVQCFSGVEAYVSALLWVVYFLLAVSGKTINLESLNRIHIGTQSFSLLALFLFGKAITSLHLINIVLVSYLLGYFLCTGFSRRASSMGVAASLLWMVLNQALIWQFFDSGSTSVLSSFALLVGLPFIYQFITSRPEDYNSNFLIIRPLFLLCFCFPLFEYIGLYLPRPQNIALLNLLVLLALAVEILKEYIFKDGARKLSFSAFLLTLCFYSLYSLEIVDSGRYYSLAILLFSMKLSLFQSKNRIKSVFRLLDYLIVFVIILAAYSKEGGFHLGELSFIFAVLVALLSLGQYADQVENKLVRMGSKLMYLKLGAGIVSVGFILGGSLWN